MSASRRLEAIRTHLSEREIELPPFFEVVRASDSTQSVQGEKRENTLSVRDNRTGKVYTVPIEHDAISAAALRKIITDDSDTNGIVCYDPGFVNTATVKSKICYIDGDKGVLEYRGYAIEELAERCSFLEVAFLLLNGELPNAEQGEWWERTIMSHTLIHEDLKHILQSFRYDAHPMGMMCSGVAALGTFYPEANPALRGQDIYDNAELRNKQIYRIIGKLPTIAACAYRHRMGRPYNNPHPSLGFVENFLYMLDSLNQPNFVPNPKLARALEVLWILHAEHEMNCSTAAMLHLASSHVDPYTCVAGASGALYGPLHGGANEAVLHMLGR